MAIDDSVLPIQVESEGESIGSQSVRFRQRDAGEHVIREPGDGPGAAQTGHASSKAAARRQEVMPSM